VRRRHLSNGSPVVGVPYRDVGYRDVGVAVLEVGRGHEGAGKFSLPGAGTVPAEVTSVTAYRCDCTVVPLRCKSCSLGSLMAVPIFTQHWTGTA
jgi:hypothetical protein